MTEEEIKKGWEFLWSGKAYCRHCIQTLREHGPNSQCWEFGYRYNPRVPLERWPEGAKILVADELAELQRQEAAE